MKCVWNEQKQINIANRKFLTTFTVLLMKHKSHTGVTVKKKKKKKDKVAAVAVVVFVNL